MNKYVPMKLIIYRFATADIVCSSSDPAGMDGDWAALTTDVEGGLFS